MYYLVMPVVIEPVSSIKKYVEAQTQGLVDTPNQQKEYNHDDIITGAAEVFNRVIDENDFCWDSDYGNYSILKVLLAAIEKVEQDYDCYGFGQEENKRLLLARISDTINVER